jgi:SWIB/MDM2 domain
MESELSRSQRWTWRSVLEDTYSDLFGVYLSYVLPDEKEVKEQFKNVLESIKKIEFCDKCGKVYRETYKDNLFVKGFTVCGNLAEMFLYMQHHGFNITPKLRKFCEIYGPLPDILSRVDVYRLIFRYIIKNNLGDGLNNRSFAPDNKLSELLGTTTPINYPTLSRYLDPHLVSLASVSNAFCYTYRMFVGEDPTPKIRDPQQWIWKSVLEDTYSDLFGVYLSYCLPDEKNVKKQFKNVLKSIKKLEFCKCCGKISRNIYKKNLFVTGFTVCGRIHGPSSGFLKPVTISSEIREFCEVYGPLPREVSRVDITKLVCRYIRKNCIINQENRQFFTPDEKLSWLLGTEEQINYFMLQRYLNQHFGRYITVSGCYTYRMFIGPSRSL